MKYGQTSVLDYLGSRTIEFLTKLFMEKTSRLPNKTSGLFHADACVSCHESLRWQTKEIQFLNKSRLEQFSGTNSVWELRFHCMDTCCKAGEPWRHCVKKPHTLYGHIWYDMIPFIRNAQHGQVYRHRKQITGYRGWGKGRGGVGGALGLTANR